ncbi:MAG: hypothetical protein HDR46_05735 [Bacteroides sp.]|nr:hypothetical protein [Bacteroides sp.]
MKGKIILLVTAIAAIIMTIAVYNLVVSEWTLMIQLSLVVVCVAELAIVSTMGLLPTLNFKNGSTGIFINLYAGMMILWSIIGCRYEGNVYPIGLLLLSLLMLLIIGLSVMGSHETDRINEKIEQTIKLKRDNLEQFDIMWLTIQSTISDVETKKRLKILIERIQSLPANRFPNPVIETSMAQITAMSQSISNTEDRDCVLMQINVKAKELTNYIKSI